MASAAGPAERRYKELRPDREFYLNRADECAKLTLPIFQSVYEYDRGRSKTKIKTPWQSIGAKGVNNLAAKLLLTLLPPNAPIFRLKANDLVLRQAQQAEIKSDIEKALAEIERATVDKIEACGDRAVVFDSLKRAVITGNQLLILEKNKSRGMPISRFVIKRDASGNLIELVIEDCIAPEALDPAFLREIKRNPHYEQAKRGKDITFYTHLKRRGKLFAIYQEVCGQKVPGSQGSYPVDRCPYIPIRFFAVDGEDYGRSYVEEYLGDLISLENLMKASVEGAAAAARTLIFVQPNGTTSQAEVANAPNGQVLTGNANDITTLQLDKRADFALVTGIIDRLERRLESAFLMNTSIQRPGERVTAEEIRFMANELDDALGGVYTIQSREFQLPFINARQHLMVIDGDMPQLPKKVVQPTILTGYDALGRNFDKQKLMLFSQGIGQAIGVDNVRTYIRPEEFIKRLATAEGIEPEGLVRTSEEVAAEQQAQQQQAMMQQLSPEALRQIGNVATKGLATNATG